MIECNDGDTVDAGRKPFEGCRKCLAVECIDMLDRQADTLLQLPLACGTKLGAKGHHEFVFAGRQDDAEIIVASASEPGCMWIR